MTLADRPLELSPSAAQPGGQAQRAEGINVGTTERSVSALGGGSLILYGLTRGSVGGLAAALLGGALLYRGVTGHCAVYERAGMSTAEEGAGAIQVEEGVTINRSPEELFRFWRDFTNLPRFMGHLESVTVQDGDGRRSHWVARAPMGRTVSWDAEITAERPNESISWRSLEGAEIENSGTVRFIPLPHGRGTEVRVSLEYRAPAGPLGALVAKLFGEEPEQQVHDDLRRFKAEMEAGEIPTVEGQPSGRA